MLTGTLNKLSDGIGMHSRRIPMSHCSVEVGDAPRRCLGISHKSWNEMQVKVLSTLAKGNGIHPITGR